MGDGAPSRTVPPPGFLRRLDGRAKLLLLIAACFVCQYLPAAWLPLWLALLSCLFFAREMRAAAIVSMLRGGLYFVGFWFLMKAGMDWLWGAELRPAVLDALSLAGRLLSLTLVGMAFVGLSSPMETGRALAWFIRPLSEGRVWLAAPLLAAAAWFLPSVAEVDLRVPAIAAAIALPLFRFGVGNNAWKLALAVALTAWFLPLTLRLAADVAAGMRARGLALPWRKKALVVVGTSLRILEHKAQELAVGLASRRLDDYRTWG